MIFKLYKFACIHFGQNQVKYSAMANLSNLKKQKFDIVKQNIKSVLVLDKNVSEAYYILAEVNYILKDYDKAIENYKIAASINPKEEEYYAKIAQCYYSIENYKDAYLYFKEASEFDIANADYRYYMAKCSIKNNDVENAIASFSLMKRLAPSNIEYIKEYAGFIAENGKKNRAVSILNSLIKEVNNVEDREEIKKYIKKIKKDS